VLDPLALRSDGTTSVAPESFSPDGRLMLYSIRDGGADEVSVRVRDLSRGRDLADSLPWALYAGLEFDRTGRGFYYVHRSREQGPRLKYHRLGTGAAGDAVLFGQGLPPTAFLNTSLSPDGRYRLYTVSYGWARNDVFLHDLRGRAQPVPLTQGLEAHFAPQWAGDQIFMRTDLDAPRGRLIAVDPKRPDRRHWRELLPEAEDVLDSFNRIDGKLYVTYVHGVSHRIGIFSDRGKPEGAIPLPPYSAATIRGAGRGKALLTVTSLTQPPVTYLVDLATGRRTDWEPATVPFDSSGIEVRQVWYTSRDGTKAPMYLMYRRGHAPDRAMPALLYGYGGFQVNLMPRFDARAAFWVEQGGLYAQATLRGGNEFGETWHRGGMLANKQHVFDDFLAAAQWLVDSGYTRPNRLAIRGVSNGGLLMGAAITQRPDLFRAAFIGYPDLDLVRFYQFRTHNNLPALLEYGDASDSAQFEVLRRFSPYQNIRPGTRYPAVMLQTGYWDTRVPPWQARKMAAGLQRATRSGLPVILLHDFRSGHAGGRSASQNVSNAAREMVFLLRMVGARPLVAAPAARRAALRAPAPSGRPRAPCPRTRRVAAAGAPPGRSPAPPPRRTWRDAP
jgi:prolyl oligopeptidase